MCVDNCDKRAADAACLALNNAIQTGTIYDTLIRAGNIQDASKLIKATLGTGSLSFTSDVSVGRRRVNIN